jgi:hypothetical protein
MQDAGQKITYQPLNPGYNPLTCMGNYSAGNWDIEDYRADEGGQVAGVDRYRTRNLSEINA